MEKQKKFEKLSHQNQSFDLQLQYNLPKVLSKLINKLDLILLESDNLKNVDVSSYLPLVLAEEFLKLTTKAVSSDRLLSIPIFIFEMTITVMVILFFMMMAYHIFGGQYPDIASLLQHSKERFIENESQKRFVELLKTLEHFQRPWVE